MSTPWFPILTLLMIIIIWLLLHSWKFDVYYAKPYPPGPKGVPVLGNIFDFPTSKWWFKFTDWAGEFGNIVHLKVVNQHIIVINDLIVAQALLESSTNADRPRFVMAGELSCICISMGFEPSIAFISYNERWRTYRRITHPVMSKQAVKSYHSMQAEEAARVVQALALAPQDYRAELIFSVSRTIMLAMYGIECSSASDTYIVTAEETLTNITHAVIPGSFAVDAFPFLKYLPYLGLMFQRKASEAQRQVKLMVERPFRQVIKDRDSATAKHSFVSALLDNEIHIPNSAIGDRDDVISWAAATMYGAAGETTHTTLLNFILAMVTNPNIQHKAHLEIDQVVGRNRMPTFADKHCLPYIQALVKEVLRWRVSLPLGVPHRCRQDTSYDGYRISEGSVIIPNLWAISRDPQLYRTPEEFLPERFIGPDSELDPEQYVFGFGPRACLGKSFAANQIFIITVHLLWAFTFSKERDETGEEINPSIGFTSGFVSKPTAFRCQITPRDNNVVAMTEI